MIGMMRVTAPATSNNQHQFRCYDNLTAKSLTHQANGFAVSGDGGCLAALRVGLYPPDHHGTLPNVINKYLGMRLGDYSGLKDARSFHG
jgi:hypothetical protein